MVGIGFTACTVFAASPGEAPLVAFESGLVGGGVLLPGWENKAFMILPALLTLHCCRAIEMNFRHGKHLNQTVYCYLRGKGRGVGKL